MTTRPNGSCRFQEWQRVLVICVSAMLAFETVTGLAIYVLPFSVPNQVMVLLHTAIGLVFVIPYAWYQVRHWRLYRALRMTHVKFTGYFAMGASVALIVSGFVLTYQAALTTRISYAWDFVHLVATFALVAAVVPHILTLIVRAVRARATAPGALVLRGVRRYAIGTAGASAVLFVGVAVGTSLVPQPEFHNAFPPDYSYLFGPDRPFAPSLATTNTGGAFDARSLAGSRSCGTAGCHEEIYREWEVSAHRYSAMDPGFQAIQKVMGEQNGPESTRYCGGCHDPISLFSGTKNLFTEELSSLAGYQEGVSCVVCHAIEKTDVQGNANYVIRQPPRYLFELDSTRAAQFLGNFLIRAYPRPHVQSLQHKLFKSPEFCAACHKQFIDEEINRVGWVQLQNQYDNWRKSRWNAPGDPAKTIECRECHMPLHESRDPARGDDLDYNRSPNDGKHRSHRFLAANQFVPLVLELPGAEEHVRLTEQWLRGELEIPEIAHKWKHGPAVPIRIVAPPKVAPGEEVRLRVLVTNNKVGHDFPTGPLDIIQAWIEILVTDQDGNVVFASGQRDDRHFIAPGSFMFKAEPVDQYGNLIDRHNLWEMVGVRYRRALFPGFSDQAEFAFSCPGSMVRGQRPGGTSPLDRDLAFRPPPDVRELRVSARLMYRKIDQFLLNYIFGEGSGLTARVTAMSEDSVVIPVRPAAED